MARILQFSFLILLGLWLAAWLEPAGAHGKGKVHVSVWRGPSHGHGKDKFAPWGYYAKLPEDDVASHHQYQHHF